MIDLRASFGLIRKIKISVNDIENLYLNYFFAHINNFVAHVKWFKPVAKLLDEAKHEYRRVYSLCGQGKLAVLAG